MPYVTINAKAADAGARCRALLEASRLSAGAKPGRLSAGFKPVMWSTSTERFARRKPLFPRGRAALSCH